MTEAKSVLLLSFEEGAEPFSGCLIHRAVIDAKIAAPYTVTLLVHSSDPAVDPHTVIGLSAELTIAGEPYLDRVPGIVSAVRQLTSVTSASGYVASYYEVTIVPGQYLVGLRAGRRIHQNRDAVSIVRDTLAACPVPVDAPSVHLAGTPPVREYTVQYDETDLDFIFRVLSEDHLTSFFDPRNGGSFVVVDDPASLTDVLPFRVPYRLPSNLVNEGPCASAVRLDDGAASGAIDLRDYDSEHPALSRAVPVTLRGVGTVNSADEPFRGEADLRRDGYEVGRFTDDSKGNAIARRDLLALRGEGRVIACDLNFALFPGTRFSIDDHQRPELGDELFAISSRIVIDDGEVIPVGHNTATSSVRTRARRSYSVRAARVSRYVPPRRPKPRAIGPETAFVVGALGDGHVDVDDYGRVLVEFIWDRRDLRSGAPTRRVRVSQGWAGANRGLVTLPRIGDEVLIGYDGGDPDQPIVVGRAHNAVARTPLNLPDPDNAVSVFRSRTIGGSGFNQFLMDDKPGKERVEIRAERTRTDLTQGSESSTIGGDFTQRVGHDVDIKVDGSTKVKIDGKLHVTAGDTTVEVGALDTRVHGTETRRVDDDYRVTAPFYSLHADDIWLSAGSSSIHLRNDGIWIDGPTVTIKGGSIKLEGGAVVISGSSIDLKSS